METYDLFSEALQRAAAARTCPPAHLLLTDDPRIADHVTHCSECRELQEELRAEQSEEDKLLLNEITRGLAAKPATGARTPVVKKGEIRGILLEDEGSTFDGYAWRNPPLVLVIEDEKDTGIKGVVRVAQISDEDSLVDQGDVFLSSDEDSPYFAEGWNTYPAIAEKLGEAIAVVSEDIVAQVVAQEKATMPELSEGSSVFIFRNLERHIGSYYGKMAAEEAVVMVEKYEQEVADIEEATDTVETSASLNTANPQPDWTSIAGSLIGKVGNSLKQAAQSVMTQLYDVAVPAYSYAPAADSHTVPLSDYERGVWDRSYGKAKNVLVTVFHLDDAKRLPQNFAAEYRWNNGELYILVPWNNGLHPLDFVFMASESSREVWGRMEGVQDEILVLYAQTEAEPEISQTKIMLFAVQE